MERNWYAESLRELILHILDRHHSFARSELVRLTSIIESVQAIENDGDPRLTRIRSLFAELRHVLVPHMRLEEQLLFPFVAMMEESSKSGRPLPLPPFVTVENPIRTMFAEHDVVEGCLRELRRLTNGFEIPQGASALRIEMLEGLRAFDDALGLHFHLENNYLFPRAVRLEDEAVAGLKDEACVLR